MEQHRIVPFYQTYNIPPYQAPYMQPYAMHGYLPLYMAQETDIREDLQYLQEMFPEMARRYAAKIASVVDRMDYKGSMIYDEFPDRLRLQRLAHDIMQMIEKEEAAAAGSGRNAQNPAEDGAEMNGMANPDMRTNVQRGTSAGSAGMNDMSNPDMRTGAQRVAAGGGNTSPVSPADSRYREELVYVLLCYEIAKRRHGAGMDLSKFYGVGDI